MEHWATVRLINIINNILSTDRVEVAIVTDTEDKLKVSTGGGGVGGGVTSNDDNKPSKTPKW